MDHDARFEELITQGLAASGTSRPQAALDLFAQAGALQPHSAIPHFLAAAEHAAAGDVEAAEAAFANAVLLAPEFALARYQLGLLQFSTGRAAVALLTWAPLLALERGIALGHFAQGFAALARERLEESLEHFGEGLACQDANPAVAGDVRQVVQAVEGLLAAGRQEDAPEDTVQHVLLSAYGRGLH